LPKRKTKQKEKGTGATPPLDPASSFGAEKVSFSLCFAESFRCPLKRRPGV